MKTFKILLITVITLISTSAYGRIYEIMWDNRSGYEVTADTLNIEIGDTVHFYNSGVYASDGYGNPGKFSMWFDEDLVVSNSQTKLIIKEYTFIPTTAGVKSYEMRYYCFDGSAQSTAYYKLSGTIKVSQPTIDLSSNFLVASYDLDGNALDGTGNGHNGTLLGPIATTDRFGNPTGAISLQESDYVDINVGTFFTGKEFSISYWVKLNQVSNGTTVIYFSDDLKFGFSDNNIVNITSGFTYINSYGGSPWNPSITSHDLNINPIPLNTWTHVVITVKRRITGGEFGNYYDSSFSYNGGNYYRMYLNGNEIMNHIRSIPVKDGNSYENITADGFFDRELSPLFGTDFTGELDDVSIWNKSLNLGEVQALYNNQSVGISEINPINVSISPNPTTDFLNISTNENIESVKVFDMKGRQVISDNTSKVDVSRLANGPYTIVVNDGYQVKFIKQ